MAKITAKQQRFVDEYLVDLNATQAAIRAGYTVKRASEMGYQLLQKTTVQGAIQVEMSKRTQRTEITQDKVLEELARVAFTNGADFARVVTVQSGDIGPPIQCVELTDTDQLPLEKRAAIAGIKQTKFGVEVATCDKLKALELLGRHLGLFERGTNTVGQNAIDDFIRATKPTKEELEALFAENDA